MKRQRELPQPFAHRVPEAPGGVLMLEAHDEVSRAAESHRRTLRIARRQPRLFAHSGIPSVAKTRRAAGVPGAGCAPRRAGPTRSRIASCRQSGTHTAVNSPARRSLARLAPSRMHSCSRADNRR
jgi:hypothetical protein